MKSILKVSMFFVLFLYVLFISTSTIQAEPIILKLGHITGLKHTETKAQDYFADLVKKKTKGQIEVQVFPASQLGSAPTQLEAVRMGAQDMYGGGTGNFGKYSKDWNVTSVGFCFRDQEHFYKVLESDVYKKMEKDLLDKYAFRFICRNGARTPKPLIAKKPVFKPEDMQGMKVRIPPWEGYVATFEAMGAKTVSIPWGEAYLALKQGIAEAASATVMGLHGQALHEVAPYLMWIEFFRDGFTIVMNEKKFQKLSSEQQKALLEAGSEAGDYYTKLASIDQEKALNAMVKEGMFLIRLNYQPFMDRMGPVIEKLDAKGFWETQHLYQRIQAVK